MTPEFKEFLSSLNAKGVEYLLVGGFAIIAHGYVRATNDLDIWVAMNPDNARRVAGVIEEFFGSPIDPDVFLKPTTLFRMGVPPTRIEVLTTIDGVEFSHCYERRLEVVIDGLSVTIISLADLRQNKAASGRPQDLADLDNLPLE